MVQELANQSAKAQMVAMVGRAWDAVYAIAKRLPNSAVKLHCDMTTWQAGPKIYYGTFNGAKGPEFDTVSSAGCSNLSPHGEKTG
jgi:hypothetical protein